MLKAMSTNMTIRVLVHNGKIVTFGTTAMTWQCEGALLTVLNATFY